MIVVLLPYSLPRSRVCPVTQEDETKMAAGGRLSAMPMIAIGNLCFFIAITICRYNPFLSSVGFISPRTALSKTSGKSQNIGFASFQK